MFLCDNKWLTCKIWIYGEIKFTSAFFMSVKKYSATFYGFIPQLLRLGIGEKIRELYTC